MGKPKTQENDNLDDENHGLISNGDEFLGFGSKNQKNPETKFDEFKKYLFQWAINGADRMLKDRRSTRNFNSGDFPAENDEIPINNSSENKRVCEKFDLSVMQARKNGFNFVGSPYLEFPLNILAFMVMVMMKIIGFQFGLLLNFFTMPIWVFYFSFMCLVFPFQTLRKIKGHIMKKLLKISVSNHLNGSKSVLNVAMRFGWATFWAIYVCFILVGLLASGFLVGSFVVKYLVEKPIQTTESLNFDYTKTSPVAFVPFMDSSSINDVGGQVINGHQEGVKYVGNRFIPYNHKMQLTVMLKVPESEYNRNLGVFQVRVEFLAANGKVTASTSYPCMLRFKSQPIRVMQTLLKSAPLITGYQSESQTLNIKTSEFIEGLEPTACLKVILEQRAEHQPGVGIPEIYAASLMIQSELPQLKKVIWNWRRTIFVWVSLMSFLTQLVFMLIVCRPIFMPRGKLKMVYGKGDDHSNTISWYKSKKE